MWKSQLAATQRAANSRSDVSGLSGSVSEFLHTRSNLLTGDSCSQRGLYPCLDSP